VFGEVALKSQYANGYHSLRIIVPQTSPGGRGIFR
jgi:hypothetical protein